MHIVRSVLAGGLVVVSVSFSHSSVAADFELRPIGTIADEYILEQDLESVVSEPVQLDFMVTPGEFEPASFVIHANRPLEGLVLRAADLKNTQGETLPASAPDIRVVKRWFQRIPGGRSPKWLKRVIPELLVYNDKLVKVEGRHNYLLLDTGEYVGISEVAANKGSLTPSPKKFPVRDAKILLPIDLDENENRQIWVTMHAPEDTPAGRYRTDIEIVYNNKVEQVVPVLVEVLPFRLSKSILDHSIYYRGKLDSKRPEGSVSSEMKSEAQLLADFRNLLDHGVTNPMVYQRYDSGMLDRYLELRLQAGIKPANLYYLGVATGGKGLQRHALDVIENAKALGYSDVYFFARDEAHGDKLLEQTKIWQNTFDVGGKIMAAGRRKGMKREGHYEVTGGLTDLFISLGSLSKAEAERWHSKGKLIFSYQNPTGGYELPLTWRRNYGLLLWQADYDGGMPYAWQHSYANAWNDFDSFGYHDHNFTYPTVEGPIDTLQWEGFREGIDDVRYLSTLLEVLESKQGKESPYAAEAQAWVRYLKTAPLGQVDLDDLRTVTAAYILAVGGYEVPADGELKISDLTVAPIEPDGSVQVSWQTNERSSSSLQRSIAGRPTNRNFSGVPMSREHTVHVTGIRPDLPVAFTVSSSVTENSIPVSKGGEIEADSAIRFQSINVGEIEGGAIFDFIPETDYRASVGVDVNRSLLGWWRFTETGDKVLDLSSWGHAGVLKGEAKTTQGWFGNGISLDGNGAFVHFPDIEIEANGTATIEGWFRFNSFAGDQLVNRSLFSGLYQHGDTNNFYFSAANEFFMAGSVLSLDTWHHIALTWSGNTSTALFFVDGKAIPVSVGGAIGDIASIDGLNIGRHGGYLGGLVRPSSTFDGDIDEIRAWSRALSRAEIQAAYRAGSERLRLKLPKSDSAEVSWSLIGANAADQDVKVEQQK